MEGIYIHDMKLPEDRAILVRIQPNGEAIVYTDDPYETDVEEVPDHGRLIDADKLLKHVQFHFYGDGGEYSYSYVDSDHITHAPTIIPESREANI